MTPQNKYFSYDSVIAILDIINKNFKMDAETAKQIQDK